MRRGFFGSIAALAAGAGAAWGQYPAQFEGPPVGYPGTGFPGTEFPSAPPPPIGGPPQFGGIPRTAIPGNAGFAPPAVIMPPGNYGPEGDPLGLGPVGQFGPPPGPMYPMPGPYAAQSYQPAPQMPPNGATGPTGYGHAPRWWVNGEYLLWFTKGQVVNFPVITTSAPNDAGLPSAASTQVLVGGGRELTYGGMNGFRLGSGFFGDADRRFGFNITGFMTERRSFIRTFGGSNNTAGIPVLARPFIDVITGQESSFVLSGPDFGPASVVFGTNTQSFSVEPSAVINLYRSEPGQNFVWSCDFLTGYKYFQVKEELSLQHRTFLNGQFNLPVFTTGPFGIIRQTGIEPFVAASTFAGVNVIAPQTLLDVRDHFRVTNKFNGSTVGFRSEARYGMFTASSFGTVAYGTMTKRIEINGGSSFFDPTGRSGSAITRIGEQEFIDTVPGRTQGSAFGGILANSSNSGTFVHDRWTYLTEGGINFGIALTRGINANIGANFIYLPEIARPGNQLNQGINPAAIPFSPTFGTPGTPRYDTKIFHMTDLWLGGATAGLTIRY